MKLALLVDAEAGFTVPEWIALAEAADAGGFDALLLSDHLRDRHDPANPGLEPFLAIAAAIRHTGRLRFGTLASPIGRRPPAELARILGTLDQLGPGRLEVSVGLGSDDAEAQAFGFPRPYGPSGYARLAEYLAVLRLLLESDDDVRFDGEYYRIHGARLSPRPAVRPRIVLGKRARSRSVQVAVRWADEYNLAAVTEQDAGRVRAVLDAASREAGRSGPLALSVMTDVLIGNDSDELATRAARHQSIRGWISARQLMSEPPPAFLIGPASRILDRIGGYTQAGVERLVLKIADVRDLAAIHQLAELVPAADCR